MIDDGAFAQGPVTGAQYVDAERAHGCLEYLPAGYDNLGALGADAWLTESLVGSHTCQATVESGKLAEGNIDSCRLGSLTFKLGLADSFQPQRPAD